MSLFANGEFHSALNVHDFNSLLSANYTPKLTSVSKDSSLTPVPDSHLMVEVSKLVCTLRDGTA
jgi:hypothetical protein